MLESILFSSSMESFEKIVEGVTGLGSKLELPVLVGEAFGFWSFDELGSNWKGG